MIYSALLLCILVEDNELNMEIAKLLVKVVSELVNGKNK